MVVCLGLLPKDLQVSLEEGGEAEVFLNIQDLSVVPKMATRDTHIEKVYGVGLVDEDEDGEDEDRAGEVASGSSSYVWTQMPPYPPVTQAESSNFALQLVFRCDVDEEVLQAIERGWTVVGFRAICRKHDLSVRGGKSEPMERVKVHFQGLYRK